MRVTVNEEDPVGGTAQLLISELCTELGDRYGMAPSPFSPSEAASEKSIFLVARIGSQAVGCGGLRRLDERTAEIKRMYVAPSARRKGIGRRVLTELERYAVTFGYRIVRLETGTLQPEAQKLYESCGYRRIAQFGKYIGKPISVCYEKDLFSDATESFVS